MNKDERFQNNSHEASNLAFADFVVRFRPFASVFGFASAMTLETSLVASDFVVLLRRETP
jgi:hypothetical protein